MRMLATLYKTYGEKAAGLCQRDCQPQTRHHRSYPSYQVVHEEARVVQDVQREDDRAGERVEIALLEPENGHYQTPQHEHPQARE